jgi:predicted RNase H-like HicB family nuclease
MVIPYRPPKGPADPAPPLDAAGHLGQLVELPEVVTEEKDLEDCRAMLWDALQKMILAYRQQGKEIPPGNALIEKLPGEIADVRQTG